VTTARGKNAQEAFSAAIEQAQYDHGHSGYTGTIAEKSEFVKINRTVDSVAEARDVAYDLMDKEDSRVDDKWGPAGCIYVGRDGASGLKTYVFFGWASS
jgi:hypothetical protein